MQLYLQPICRTIVTYIYFSTTDGDILEFLIHNSWGLLWNFYLLLPASALYAHAWTLSELLAEICSEMERSFADGRDVGRIVQVSGVRHSLVCQAVWRLAQFFSNVILVDVACIFVSSINYCFFIMDENTTRRGYLLQAMLWLFNVLPRFAVLEAIGQVAERMKDKVCILNYYTDSLLIYANWHPSRPTAFTSF